ncbi:hypothetical protein UFOVP1247_30 [uncultured Caudovirales phage]|uniref:Uncharacterized protein n=1 Tax=uncultured Caudovirales phage TaxID=2100421 RepID=A0A6J5PS42_9CAUD|nr:hypothetical protein UFOVP970_70 [uncultured Caudovirales phage]CAB4193162.1 hypothetical protein UFOVP1247_30 [uncultured Caudovirales phage]
MIRKHIPSFLKWTSLNETENMEDDFDQLEEEVTSLNNNLTQAIQDNRLTTRILMDWFNSMMDLYNSREATAYIAEELGNMIKIHVHAMTPFFTVRNTELTRQDIATIRQYKQLVGIEATNTKKAEDRLRDLGLL